jgi:secreted trypsin-like serine protease
MTTLRSAPLPIAALLVLAAGCGPGVDAATPNGELRATSNAIVGGTTDHGHSAVALLYQDPGYICSGTIVDERVYLTAAHCIESLNPNDYLVIGGTDLYSDDPDYTINVEAVHIHPSYDPESTLNDIGVVELSTDSPVAPYRWHESNDDEYDVGNRFTAVGFGDTGGSGDTSGTKRKVAMDILETYQDIYLYGTGTENTCFGDSGGPDIVEIDGYLTVLGVHSFVTGGGCFGNGGSMRTDDNRTFIDNFAAPDAGTAKAAGGGGGSDNPLACSLASVRSESPLAAALMALVALSATVGRRRTR